MFGDDVSVVEAGIGAGGVVDEVAVSAAAAAAAAAPARARAAVIPDDEYVRVSASVGGGSPFSAAFLAMFLSLARL